MALCHTAIDLQTIETGSMDHTLGKILLQMKKFDALT